jgi:hypothetical protein
MQEWQTGGLTVPGLRRMQACKAHILACRDAMCCTEQRRDGRSGWTILVFADRSQLGHMLVFWLCRFITGRGRLRLVKANTYIC